MKYILLLLSFTCFAQYSTEQVVQLNDNQAMTLLIIDDTYSLVSYKRGQVKILNNFIENEDNLVDVGGIIPNTDYETFASGEQGLLDIAYKNNQLWLLYCVNRKTLNDTITSTFGASVVRLTRYDIDLVNNTAMNRTVILGANDELHTGIPILATNHVGGSLNWDSQSNLLIVTGDGANGQFKNNAIALGIIPDLNYVVNDLRAMQLSLRNGKVLRIDAQTGNGIPDNSYYDINNPKSSQSQIYNIGIRNSIRATVKPNTDSLFIAHVGLSNWEAGNISHTKGLNHGWAMKEGYENYRSGNQINFETGTTFSNTFISDLTTLETPEDLEVRRWTWKPAIFTYHQFNGIYQTFENLQVVEHDFNYTSNASITGCSFITSDLYGNIKNGILFADFFNNFLMVYKDNQFIDLNINLDYVIDIVEHPITKEIYLLQYTGKIYKLNYETLYLKDLDINNIPINEDYIIYDLLGREIKKGKTDSNIFNWLKKGVYLLSVKGYEVEKIII